MLPPSNELPHFAAHHCIIFTKVCSPAAVLAATGLQLQCRYHRLPSSYGDDSYIINSISRPQRNNLQCLQGQTQTNRFPDILFPSSQTARVSPRAREEDRPAEKWIERERERGLGHMEGGERGIKQKSRGRKTKRGEREKK